MLTFRFKVIRNRKHTAAVPPVSLYRSRESADVRGKDQKKVVPRWLHNVPDILTEPFYKVSNLTFSVGGIYSRCPYHLW